MLQRIRFSLSALVSGLMLAACGVPEESGLLPSDEPLGTQEAALDCSGASVSSLLSQGFDAWGGEASGAGTWSVTHPSNSVFLQYYINGQFRGEKYEKGDANRSGPWNYNGPVGCGTHTFEVRAFPAFYNSTTQSFTGYCSTGSKSLSISFIQACPTASLSCSRTSSTTITCTGGASGGSGGPYTAQWREHYRFYDGSEYLSPWWSSGFTESFYCQQTLVRDPTDRLTISFKARDNSGMESGVKSLSYLCAP